jgi:hypothetical protein
MGRYVHRATVSLPRRSGGDGRHAMPHGMATTAGLPVTGDGWAGMGRPEMRSASSWAADAVGVMGVVALALSVASTGWGKGGPVPIVRDLAAAARTPAPSSPPATVCGSPTLKSGPTSPPVGAVTLTPGADVPGVVRGDAPGTTFWFTGGTFVIGPSRFDQIEPQANDTFVGAPGAVLSGQGVNEDAFGGPAPDVTIEYLTIEHFVAPQNEGVVNHNSAAGWVIEHDTIGDNPHGAGVMLGSGDVLSDNCITKNGQYGFQSYSTTSPPTRVTVAGNEISDNDTADYTQTTPGCGCSGGGKFWETQLATVTGNYVTGNKSVGLWMDTDNAGFDVAGNYFSTNFAEGIVYEISYNARIVDNTFVHNGVGEGPENPGFPTGAIYVSGSGSDPRVPGPYGRSLLISGNVFTDNWSGVVLWETANRYCGSSANTSTGSCTLVQPRTYTAASCAAHVPTSRPHTSPDYYDDCRWKTENVSITRNTFTFKPSAVGHRCAPAEGCGYNALFSEYGTYSPYKGWVVPHDLADAQHDRFFDNTYRGPWHFMAFNQGESVTWAQWTSGFPDVDGSGDRFAPQDAGSRYAG